MQPYRIHTGHDERRIVRIGDDRHRVLSTIVSLLLVGLTLASILGWLLFGGRVHGSILIPAIVGLGLLFRRRATSIEYVRDRHELHVEHRSIVGRRRARVPVGDITGLTLMSVTHGPSEEFELRLLMRGGRSLRLMGPSQAARIDPARAAVSSFLLEQGLLQGGLEAGPTARIRLAAAAEADATHDEMPTDAADPRRGRS